MTVLAVVGATVVIGIVDDEPTSTPIGRVVPASERPDPAQPAIAPVIAVTATSSLSEMRADRSIRQYCHTSSSRHARLLTGAKASAVATTSRQ